MCTEFFLAFIYFLTIIIVNYFLYKLITNYLTNISYLLKINIILKDYPENQTYSLFYKLIKKDNKKVSLLKQLSLIDQKADILILGNIYKYLDENLEKSRNINSFNNYYFNLLRFQYLSNDLHLK
jgi:hypothetical protein